MSLSTLVLAGARSYLRVLAPIVGVALIAGLSAGALFSVKQQIDAANLSSAAMAVPEGQVLVASFTADEAFLLHKIGANPIRDVDCSLSTLTDPPRSGEIALRFATSPAFSQGRIYSGRSAKVAGEMVVTVGTANELGIVVGDTVHCEDHEFRVVGRIVDPANRGSVTAFAIADEIPVIEATAWFLDSKTYFALPSEPEDEAHGGNIIGATSGEAIEAATAGFASNNEKQQAVAGLIVLSAIVGATALGALGRRAYESDVAVCVSLGASARKINQLVTAVFFLALFIASIGGVLTAQVVINLSADWLSVYWNQYWLMPKWSGVTIGLTSAVIGTGPILAIALARWISKHSRVPPRGTSVIALILLLGAQVAFGLYLVFSSSFYDAAPWFASVALVGGLALAAFLFTPRTSDAVDALIREGMKGTFAFAVIVGLVLFPLTFNTVRSDNLFAQDKYLDLADSGQRPGALVVRQVPQDAVEKLTNAYLAVGGTDPVLAREVTWRDPVPEAVTAKVANCVEEDPTIEAALPPARCLGKGDWFGKAFSVSANHGSNVPAQAAREILRDGRVGVILRAADGTVQTLSIPAVQNNSLGRNMPGLLLDREFIDSLGGETSDEFAMYFDDFGDLGAKERSEFRAVVSSRAAGSVVDQNDESLDSIWGVKSPPGRYVFFVAMLLGFLTFLTILLVGFVSSNRALRIVLIRNGAPKGLRQKLAMRMLSLLLIACISAPLFARSTLWVMQKTADFDFSGVGAGWRWVIPGFLGVVFVGVAALSFARPLREGEIE